MTDAIDPARCPLCGGPNACAIMTGAGVCWCFTTKVPDHVIERVPPDARERACVCERCATTPPGATSSTSSVA